MDRRHTSALLILLVLAGSCRPVEAKSARSEESEILTPLSTSVPASSVRSGYSETQAPTSPTVLTDRASRSSLASND